MYDLTSQRLLAGAAGAGAKVYVEDVFQTWLYTGNGSTQTITNGVDLAGKGGLVWTKNRNSGGNHTLIDTARGTNKYLMSDSTNAENSSYSNILTSFNSNGYTLGADLTVGNVNYSSAYTYASWTFRKQAKFFDVVTFNYTSGSIRVPHSLGSVPGCIIVKYVGGTSDWYVYHRSRGRNYYSRLNQTFAEINVSNVWDTTDPTSTDFGMSNYLLTAGTWVAYVFAHDAGGFGASGNDSVVSCGSFTMSSGDVTVNLGYEPQWLLIKSTGNAEWGLYDVMRGLDYTNPVRVTANTSNAEAAIGGNYLRPTPTGFVANSGWFGSSATFIYIAIRRGPMKTPTDATKVFSANTTSAAAGTAITTGFPVDTQIFRATGFADTLFSMVVDRLRGVSTTDTAAAGPTLATASSGAENTSASSSREWTNTSFEVAAYLASQASVYWNFRRAPGFFDVVAYTGTGSARTVSHNLGVVPELMIVKLRNTPGAGNLNWTVYSAALGNSSRVFLNSDSASGSTTVMWDSTTPGSSSFTVGTSSFTNDAAGIYIAYLFASCPGVSKVGSYTGTGTTLSIDCGFTNGARFVLIKRTDSTGDWYVWDSARGIVAGNDPYLLLNSTAAEVTGTDYVDTYSAGFEISSTAPAAINANGGSFIFLAVA